jgi:hypothetical protein
MPGNWLLDILLQHDRTRISAAGAERYGDPLLNMAPEARGLSSVRRAGAPGIQ